MSATSSTRCTWWNPGEVWLSRGQRARRESSFASFLLWRDLERGASHPTPWAGLAIPRKQLTKSAQRQVTS